MSSEKVVSLTKFTSPNIYAYRKTWKSKVLLWPIQEDSISVTNVMAISLIKVTLLGLQYLDVLSVRALRRCVEVAWENRTSLICTEVKNWCTKLDLCRLSNFISNWQWSCKVMSNHCYNKTKEWPMGPFVTVSNSTQSVRPLNK